MSGPEEPPAKRARVDADAEEGAVTAVDHPAVTQKHTNPLSLAHRLALRNAPNDNGESIDVQERPSAEQLVGISAYVNSSVSSFKRAIIKHRFTDFLVWEIARGGEVVRLKDIGRPETVYPVAQDAEQKDKETAASDTTATDRIDGGQGTENVAQSENVADLKEFMNPEKLEELETFFKAGKVKDAAMRTDPIEAKDRRKAFHAAVRAAFGGKLSTEAEEEGVVRIEWTKADSRDRRSVRPSNSQQSDLPKHIQFTLHKTNRETQDCLGHLSSRMGVNSKDLTTAGTKDKRGVTTQLVTLRRGRKTLEDVWDQVNGQSHGKGSKNNRGGRSAGASRAEKVLTERGERGLRIGDLCYVDSSLELGMLEGNRFCIALREIEVESEEIISQSLGTLRDTGFINYYGMQRFGNSSVPTHAVGLALLRSDWKEATRLILSEKDGDSDEVRQARRYWTVDRNASKCLRNLPRWAVAERCIIEHFDRQGGDSDTLGALSRIPKNLRMMYVHGYQSYLWNSAASERVKLDGVEKPMAGDLVYDVDDSAEDQQQEAAEASSRGNGKVTEASIRAASRTAKVKRLLEAELDSYTIHDVVLPLPGYSTVYPGGRIGDLYRSMMQADGLDPDNMFRAQKEYSMGGSYRKLITKPKDVTWSLLHYSEPDEQLLQVDEDVLLGFPSPETQGDRLALKVEFSLDTASYATMALREVLKMETGNVEQAQMSANVI